MDKCLKSVSLHVLNSTWLLDILLFFPHRQKSGGKKKKKTNKQQNKPTSPSVLGFPGKKETKTKNQAFQMKASWKQAYPCQKKLGTSQNQLSA